MSLFLTIRNIIEPSMENMQACSFIITVDLNIINSEVEKLQNRTSCSHEGRHGNFSARKNWNKEPLFARRATSRTVLGNGNSGEVGKIMNRIGLKQNFQSL